MMNMTTGAALRNKIGRGLRNRVWIPMGCLLGAGFGNGARRRGPARFWRAEDGIGTLEIVLIAAVLILVAILFKDWILKFLHSLMSSAEDKAGTIFD